MGALCRRLGLGLSGAVLAAAVQGAAAQSLSLRLVNDQASTLQLPLAPAGRVPAFRLERRDAASRQWIAVQAAETAFCLNPCPATRQFPAELDCGRPPRRLMSLPAGGELAMAWSGQIVEEVMRRHASGTIRTCTQLRLAPPGIYRLSLCAEAPADEPARCAALTFVWRPNGARESSTGVLRWSVDAIVPPP